MFFPFPILAFFAYDRLTNTPWQALAALISISAIGCAFAGMTEVVQDFLPYRVKDFNDFGADCLAVGIASVLVFIIDVSKMKKE
jgi:VanZ family protein